MDNFKESLKILTVSTSITLAYTLFRNFEDKSWLGFIIALIAVIGLSWLTLAVYKFYEQGLYKRYYKRLNKFVNSVIEKLDKDLDFNARGLELVSNSKYIDVKDLTKNGQLLNSWELPDLETFKLHPEIFSLASKEELEHLITVYISNLAEGVFEEQPEAETEQE